MRAPYGNLGASGATPKKVPPTNCCSSRTTCQKVPRSHSLIGRLSSQPTNFAIGQLRRQNRPEYPIVSAFPSLRSPRNRFQCPQTLTSRADSTPVCQLQSEPGFPLPSPLRRLPSTSLLGPCVRISSFPATSASGTLAPREDSSFINSRNFPSSSTTTTIDKRLPRRWPRPTLRGSMVGCSPTGVRTLRSFTARGRRAHANSRLRQGASECDGNRNHQRCRIARFHAFSSRGDS